MKLRCNVVHSLHLEELILNQEISGTLEIFSAQSKDAIKRKYVSIPTVKRSAFTSTLTQSFEI